MVEPTCLMRSFSHPSNASCEAKEGDPYRALTESISFGRFMSESLAWEKWSTFSHNRYLEEVEQFSKPGSVAQKKAYFEAHYKKRAAMKAAALLEQANAKANDVPEVKTAEVVHDESHANSELAKAWEVNVDEGQEKDVIGTEPVHSADANSIYQNGQDENLQNMEAKMVEEIIEQNVELEKPIQLENSKKLDDAEDGDKIVALPEEKKPNKDASEKENVALTRYKKQISSLKSSSQNAAPKIQRSSSVKQTSWSRTKAGANAAPNNRNPIGELTNKSRSAPKSVHMSISFASRSGESSSSSLRMSKDSSSAQNNLARVSVNGVAKFFSSMVRQSEARRSKSVLKSVSGGINAGRVLQTLSEESSKSSASTASKARPSIISTPFSFRSEERAAKRKEFFQKLEEKSNAKEAERAQLHSRSKVKPVSQIPLTRARSPKHGRKPNPSMGQDTKPQLPRKPPANAESSKRAIPKSNQRSSITLLPKKKQAYENASPNIQH